MKLLLPVRSPVRAFGAALFDTGLRVREEYDELILNQRDFELRIHATERSDGCVVHCHVSVAELGFAPGSLGLFSEMAMEGYPWSRLARAGGRSPASSPGFTPRVSTGEYPPSVARD
jgi:hypothetical protein